MQLLPFTGLRIRAICLIASMLSLLISIPATAQSTDVIYALENDVMKLSNAYYEVSLSTVDGGITSIVDKSTNQPISGGNLGNNLWSVALDNGQFIDSSSYVGHFTQVWDETKATLTLNYDGTLAVAIAITVSTDHTLRMQASVTNQSGANISDFHFPGRLKVAAANVQDALLPMMPGALLSSQFFTDGRSFIGEYPGVIFADYLGVRSAHGKITVYSQRGEFVQPILIGYEASADDPDYTTLTHKYQTWIADTETWVSPWVIVNIGDDYPDTILGYRTDNGIDDYRSLEAKLGDSAQTYFEAPMYKLDLAALRLKFVDIETRVIPQMNFPGIVHLVAFQPRGHDKNYPDFFPPDSKLGTTDDFMNAVNAIHNGGSLAVPYTNFSWWDASSPTMANLPGDTPLNSLINVKDSHGLPGFESYGPNSGFVMNLHNDFVRNKISEQHNILLNTIGVDAIFEDQWGARSAPYDFNPAGLDTYDPSTSYYEGVLQHYRDHLDSGLMTEVGVDMLAEDGIAFMGTNYLWDMLGYRSATAGVTSYYPMAGMLLRDKVLLYQHDLAAETWTKNKDMLRWNLAQGYNLSNAFLDPNGGLNIENPWLNLMGVFQKYVLANYADELVVSYDDLGNNVAKTVFSTYSVYSNWDTAAVYSMDGHTLPPGGVFVQANDGSVTGGTFTAYNDHLLSEGDHYLVEVRSPDEIMIFQPVGDDTPLSIRNPSSWTSVNVTAHQYDGTVIGSVELTLSDDGISFSYLGTLDGQPVGYYTITSAE